MATSQNSWCAEFIFGTVSGERLHVQPLYRDWVVPTWTGSRQQLTSTLHLYPAGLSQFPSTGVFFSSFFCHMHQGRFTDLKNSPVSQFQKAQLHSCCDLHECKRVDTAFGHKWTDRFLWACRVQGRFMSYERDVGEVWEVHYHTSGKGKLWRVQLICPTRLYEPDVNIMNEASKLHCSAQPGWFVPFLWWTTHVVTHT